MREWGGGCRDFWYQKDFFHLEDSQKGVSWERILRYKQKLPLGRNVRRMGYIYIYDPDVPETG